MDGLTDKKDLSNSADTVFKYLNVAKFVTGSASSTPELEEKDVQYDAHT